MPGRAEALLRKLPDAEPLLAACEAAGIATLSNRPFDGLSAFGKEKRY